MLPALLLACLPGAGLAPAPAKAYEASTHLILSVLAARHSRLYGDAGIFRDLGLSSVYAQDFRTTDGQSQPFDQAVGFGAVYEDDHYAMRALNHFFDPQFAGYQGRGLAAGGLEGHASPDWALEDRGERVEQTDPRDFAQEFSFRDGQRYLYEGLTALSPAERQARLSLAVQSLGHVIHHLQDMGQPQHSRNDIHPPLLPRHSFYERYSARHLDGRILNFVQAQPYPVPTLPTARHYWHLPGGTQPTFQGMAAFTSENYVTIGSSFGTNGARILAHPDFPLPNGWNPDGSPKVLVREDREVQLWTGQRRRGQLDYVRGTVHDGLVPARSRQGQRLAATSILDRPLLLRGRSRTFAENSAIFEDMYPVLVPRMVAFSAGLINHFFRGRLDFRRNVDDSRWVVENRSGTTVNGVLKGQAINGQLQVFHEDGAGRRRALPGAVWTVSLAAGQTRTLSFPDPPAGTRRLVAVFRGQVGEDGDATLGSGYYTTAGKVVEYGPPPTACGGLQTAMGSSEGLDLVHELGSTRARVPLEFEAYQITDRLELRAENPARTLLAATGGYVSGFRSWSIDYDPEALGTTRVRLRITGNQDPKTLWTTALGCPGQTIPNGSRVRPRITVGMRWGTLFQGALGGCHADLYVDGAWLGRISVTATGGGSSRTLILTKGEGHGYEYRNYSCESGTRNLLTAGEFTDSSGTYPLQPMSKPGVHLFEVR